MRWMVGGVLLFISFIVKTQAALEHYLHRPQFCNSEFVDGKLGAATFVLSNSTLEECSAACDAGAWCRAFERVASSGTSGSQFDKEDCLLLRTPVKSETENGGYGCNGSEKGLDLYERPSCKWEVKQQNVRCAGKVESYSMELPYKPAPEDWTAGCDSNGITNIPGTFDDDHCLDECIRMSDYRCTGYQVESDKSCTLFTGIVSKSPRTSTNIKCFVVDQENAEQYMFERCQQYMSGIKTCGTQYSYSKSSPDKCTCVQSWPFVDSIQKKATNACELQSDAGFVTYELKCETKVIVTTSSPTDPGDDKDSTMILYVIISLVGFGIVTALTALTVWYKRKAMKQPKPPTRKLVVSMRKAKSNSPPFVQPPSRDLERAPVTNSGSSGATTASSVSTFKRGVKPEKKSRAYDPLRKISTGPPSFIPAPPVSQEPKEPPPQLPARKKGSKKSVRKGSENDNLEDISWLEAKKLAKQLGLENAYGSREQLLVRIGTALSNTHHPQTLLPRYGTIPDFLTEYSELDYTTSGSVDEDDEEATSDSKEDESVFSFTSSSEAEV